jgi:hypothetical protein
MKPPKVSAAAVKRIWEGDGYRLFLSHKSEVSKEVLRLKSKLEIYGISAFVAHSSIKPTLQWQNEIENGLHSMEALAALITKDFHDSNWTDQEVGFALGRSVPVIPVRLEENPRGFLARVQAVSCNWDNAARRIVELLIEHAGMFAAYVQAIRDCGSYDNANVLAKILPSIVELDDERIAELVDAYNSNGQVYDSFGWNGLKSYPYGDGLLPHLHRLGSQKYEMSGRSIRMAAPTRRRRRD